MTATKRVRVLLNAEGGSVKSLGAEEQAARVVAAFDKHGVAANVAALPGRQLEKAIAHARGDVVVGGGDGTIAAAAGVLAGSRRTLGVLPLGTLNHFAKDLGVPTLEKAVAAIAARHVARVDVGEVGGKVFINNSSIGFYPRMVAERTREQRASGMPKWPAMALAALRTLRRFPHHRLSIRVDGDETPCVTPCVFVGNNDYRLTGFDLGKRKRLDGGGLLVVVVRGTTLWSLVGPSLRAAIGRVDEADDIEVTRGVTALTIDSHAGSVEVSHDGEVTRMPTPIDYRIRPAALRVFAPLR